MKNAIKTYGRAYIIITLILVPFFIFIKAADYNFVWDDTELYITEKNFPQDSPLSNILDFWLPGQNKMYAPVTYTAWAITAALSPVTATGQYDTTLFHLLNIFLHILNGVLVFLILNKLLKDQWPAFAGALLFSLHPLQVESVAWISETRGLLAAAFGLVSIWLYIRYLRKLEADNEKKTLPTAGNQQGSKQKKQPEIVTKEWEPRTDYIISIIAGLLAMFAKPTGVVIPLILYILDYFILRHDARKAFRSIWVMLAAMVPILIITLLSEPSAANIQNISLYERPVVFLDTIVFYLYKLFLPVNLVASYGRTPEYVVNSLWIYFALIIPALLALVFWLERKKNKNYLAALLIFIAGYLPLSGIVPFYFQYFSTVADRYVYISMLGAAFAFAYLISYKQSRAYVALYIVLILAFAGLTMGQVGVWKNEFSLWNNVIEKYPDKSPQAYSGRGLAYTEMGAQGSAIRDFTNAIKLNPKDPTYFYNRGNVFMDIGNYTRAIEDFTKTIELKGDLSSAYYNRGLANSEMGRYDEAILDFTSALNGSNIQSDIYVNRGISYAQTGNINYAIDDFKTALELNPNDSIAFYNLKMAQEILLVNRKIR